MNQTEIRLICLCLAVESYSKDYNVEGAHIRDRARRFTRFVFGTESLDDLMHDKDNLN